MFANNSILLRQPVARSVKDRPLALQCAVEPPSTGRAVHVIEAAAARREILSALAWPSICDHNTRKLQSAPVCGRFLSD
jgi:hypothetical protein